MGRVPPIAIFRLSCGPNSLRTGVRSCPSPVRRSHERGEPPHVARRLSSSVVYLTVLYGDRSLPEVCRQGWSGRRAVKAAPLQYARQRTPEKRSRVRSEGLLLPSISSFRYACWLIPSALATCSRVSPLRLRAERTTSGMRTSRSGTFR